jgi:hypothetical protein
MVNYTDLKGEFIIIINNEDIFEFDLQRQLKF